MAIRMPSPTLRDNSRNLMFRQRVPKAMLDAVKGKTAFFEISGVKEPTHFLAKATIDTHVKFSLRTADPAEAKARQSQAIFQLEQFFRAASGPTISLSHMQIVALSGVAYHFYLNQFQENPGSTRSWAAFKAFNRACREGRVFGVKALPMGSIDDPADVEVLGNDLTTGVNSLPIVAGSAMPEIRFRDITDWILAKNGLSVDAKTRRALITEIERALTDIAWRLKRASEGDYSPDPKEHRFPPLATEKTTITSVFEKWKAERKPAPSTVTTWKTSLASLKAHLGHEDIASVTERNVIAWKDKLVASGLTAKTINSTYLASVDTLMNFAIQNKILKSSPAKGVKILARARAGERMLPYTSEEVSKLVALAIKSDKPNQKWPLLLAVGTGARIGELTQLWKQSIQEIDGIAVIRISPAEDAGSLKNAGSERNVPVHPTLIKLGFLDFVSGHKEGPLFYKKASGRPGARHASKGVTNRLSTWIRDNGFKDARKAPNHALRHWWKSTAVTSEISNSVADVVQGHASGNESDTYRHYDLATLAKEIAKMPFPGVPVEEPKKEQ